jgi:L-amino acid N-acyltransferase YncA
MRRRWRTAAAPPSTAATPTSSPKAWGVRCSATPAYAGPYRTRPAYRFAVENSIYVAPEAAGGGVGRALLPALIERCTRAGFRLMVAVIGDSANAASIRLHARCGFAHAGLLPAVGWKHGRWVDSVLMTRALGEGSATPPPPGR